MNIATDGIFPYQRTQKRDIIEIPYTPLTLPSTQEIYDQMDCYPL